MQRGLVPDYGLADLRRWLRRLPIRWRLTLTFAAVMAALLAALIAFLSLRFRSDLDYTIDGSLRARAQEVASLARNDHGAATRGDLGAATGGVSFVQILSPSGRVIGATAGYSSAALLSHAEIARAIRTRALIQRGERERLYAMGLADHRAVVVAGVSLSQRDAALDKLAHALLIGVPPALALASLAAYLLATAALAPVERMRRRAATISTAEISTRLPLPESQDEIRRLGMTLNQMLDRLDDGLRHEREFVANASHELRMPLAVLRAELEVALREHGGERNLRAAIASAMEETDRIVKLAEDLLLLARATDGTLPIDPEDLPVAELLDELAAKFAPVVSHDGRALAIDPGANPQAVIHADPSRLDQAIANLVDNSLRYGAGPITLSARDADGAVELHVCDRGNGFSDQFRPRAFDRFSRDDPARRRGGVGLGLAVVLMVAEAHGGQAGADNAPGGGADVWLRLPDVHSSNTSINLD